jgi:hypothetical protein
MKKCLHPEHPHCTLWIMPGETTCASGHEQAAAEPTSFDLLGALRHASAASAQAWPASGFAAAAAELSTDRPAPTSTTSHALPSADPYLHISGFDPRAAGGRQTIKLELRGMPPHTSPQLTMHLQSALIPNGASRHAFVRSLRGDWRPLFVEFSSRDKEHGQYQVDVELHRQVDGRTAQKWVCTLVILVPRIDASLSEIHQTFLSTHKNVRVTADDASIAKVKASTGGGRLDIDINARNGAIARLDLDNQGGGKVDLGMPTIAWDEDLIEIDVPAASLRHAHPSRAACLVNAAPEAGAQRQIRLFAMEECVLGRLEVHDPEADVLLTHFGDAGPEHGGLTRRLSARHALVRRGSMGFEIEDVSRYGMLIDGVWPGKEKPVTLRLGMTIELSASIKGIVVLAVTALLPNGVIMHRLDQGQHAECFYFLEPECHPGFPLRAVAAAPRAAVLPLLYHYQGGFWHLDPATGRETPLGPTVPMDKLCHVPRHTRFAPDPYPEAQLVRLGGIDQYQQTLLHRPRAARSAAIAAAL